MCVMTCYINTIYFTVTQVISHLYRIKKQVNVITHSFAHSKYIHVIFKVHVDIVNA